ncbi:CU044_5270 family protein [Streptosporangium sp. CA-135522]|uniref:CU044_5270 family protein n=1 Tax=Streptosporangium sp. CA-135522 TaxID=3240072 RepID=UPI003D9239BE
MDDLQTLATLLAAPEPSPQAAERSLRRLQQRMRRPSRPRRRAWFAAGMSLAAAAAAAIVVVSGTAAPTATPNGPPPAAVRLSAGQILLAAATNAERAPEGSGAYWYVKTGSDGGEGWESWTARDGRGTWVRGKKTAGKVVELGMPAPLRLGGLEVGFEQLRKLPAEPEALKSWISDGLERGDVKTSAGRLDAAGQAHAVFNGLVSLVSQLPASPEVRAAAFRALAAYPAVESLGAVDGGEGLLIPVAEGPPVRLVVDPATSRVRNTSFFVTADGGEVFLVDKPVTIDARWTDTLPDGD